MHIQRIIVIIFSVIGMFSTFLPWVVTDTILGYYSVNGTEAHGWFTLLLFSICSILVLVSNIHSPIKESFKWGIAISSLLAGIVVVIDVVNASNNLNNIVGSMLSSTIELGIGIYIILICSVSIPISLLIKKFQGNEISRF